MLPPESFRPNEVLAYNLPAAALLTIENLKYKVLSTYELRSLNLTVTRLEVPTVQNAFIGRSALQEELPTSGFGLNHIYRADRPMPSGATNGGAAPLKSAAAPAIASPGTGVGRPNVGCAPDRCFGLSAINWQPKLAACARGVRIGVIDTGVDKNHPAFADVLAGKRLRHKDFTPSNSKKPSNQHGTGVLSLLAGNAHGSTPGLVPDATFLVGDAFFTDHHGNAISDTVTMLKAIDWLIEQGVDVANLSFAGPPDEFVHESIRKLARKGTVILAAAGNEGRDAPPSFPAAYPEVIAVTAVDRNLAAYAYAGRGDHIDVAAPGVEVWTALPNRREGPQTGTSFAVPFVTSVLAVNYSTVAMRTDGNPLAPKRRALALLQKDVKAIGERGRNPVFGVGLVQAPSHCDPHTPEALISSAPQLQPAPFVPAGSWESTVHPVANRK
jgi:subtilisin family serine protease